MTPNDTPKLLEKEWDEADPPGQAGWLIAVLVSCIAIGWGIAKVMEAF